MTTPTSDRFGEIDLLRTLAILLMIVYHTAYDLSAYYSLPIDPMHGGWLLLERATAHLFLLLVGISFAISWGKMEKNGKTLAARMKRIVRRALGIFFCAMLVSLATFVVDPHTYVRFGVLHLIAVSVLLLPIFMSLREWNFLLAVIVILATPFIVSIPVATPLLLPLGLAPPSFASVDYFPLFPWFGTVMIGAGLGNLLYNRALLRWHVLLSRRWQRMITFPGRHSLLLYLIHQPIILGVLWVWR